MNQFLLYFIPERLVLAATWVLATFVVLPGHSHTSQLATLSRLVTLIITGQIVNSKGAPLPGVFITVKDEAANATTNATGGFLLACEQPAPVLTLKCVGYQTQIIALKVAGPVTITMYEVGAAGAAPVAGVEAVNDLLNLADEQPVYPGGAAAYRTYLQQNVRYPEKAKDHNVSGDVYVKFIIDEVGRILDPEVIKGVGSGLDEEALRLVRLMPWWTPGRLAGQPVRVPVTLRLRFGMQQESTPLR